MGIDIDELRQSTTEWAQFEKFSGEVVGELLDRIEAAEKGLVELRLGVSKQQSLTDAAQQLAEAAQRRADKLSARAEAAEKERDVLRNRLALESQENGALRDSVARACEERDSLRADKATLQQMTYSLKDRLEAAEKERDAARDLADRLALALNTSNHERDNLRAKIAEMGRPGAEWFDWLPQGTSHISSIRLVTIPCFGLEARFNAFKYIDGVLYTYMTDDDNKYGKWVEAASRYRNDVLPTIYPLSGAKGEGK